MTDNHVVSIAIINFISRFPGACHVDIMKAAMAATKAGRNAIRKDFPNDKAYMFYRKEIPLERKYSDYERNIHNNISIAMERLGGRPNARQIIEWAYKNLHVDRVAVKKAAQKILTDKAAKKQVKCARQSVPLLMIPTLQPGSTPIIQPLRKKCPRCGAPLTINDGGYGTYFVCGICGYIGG